MELKFNVKSNVDVKKYVKKINNPKFWLATTNEFKKIITPYTPKQTGQLSEKVKIDPKRLKYIVPYAKEQYYNNKNPRRDKHPKATRYWDKVAMKTQKDKLIKFMQKYINKYGILK